MTRKRGIRSRWGARGDRRRRPALWLVPACVALTAGALLYVALGTDLFVLREVHVHCTAGLPADSLRAVSAGMIGSNLLTVPLDALRERFLEFPRIKEVRFSRTLLNRLDCYVREREPAALVAAGDLFEVDDEGVLIDDGRGIAVDLPVITGIGPGELGTEEGGSKIGRALQVLRLFKMFGFDPAAQLSEIHVEGDEIMLVWMETGSIVLVGRDDFFEKMRKFRAYVGAREESDSFPTLVDLRFERQVVVR